MSAKFDFLAFPQQVMNQYEWEVRLACKSATNFRDPRIRRENNTLYQLLLKIGAQYAEEAGSASGDADAIFSAIFGGEGLKINPSMIDSGMQPASRGDMLTFKSTFEKDFFLSEMNAESANLVDLEMDFATQSHAIGILTTGKAYFASLLWYVRAVRTTNSAGLGIDDPFYSQASIPEQVNTTKFAWERMSAQARISEVNTIFLGGKLVDVGAYAAATKEVPTGSLKITGNYAVNHEPGFIRR